MGAVDWVDWIIALLWTAICGLAIWRVYIVATKRYPEE